jgi:hypothetical protein
LIGGKMARRYDTKTKEMIDDDGTRHPVSQMELWLMCTDLKATLMQEGMTGNNAATVVAAFFGVEENWSPDNVDTRDN